MLNEKKIEELKNEFTELEKVSPLEIILAIKSLINQHRLQKPTE